MTRVRCNRVFLPLVAVLLGCRAGPETARWNGSLDTLASGTIAVANPSTGMWEPGEAWTVVEELRIGTVEGTGPDLFSTVAGLAVDAAGRIFVLDAHTHDVRVFDTAGTHVRTFGREGGGPGEFGSPTRMNWGPDGNLWIADPKNNRMSIFDTAGAYLGSRPAAGGWVTIPWPGGFDDDGYLYNPVFLGDGIHLVRYAPDGAAVDTFPAPRFPGKREFFELNVGTMRMTDLVPFTPGLSWRLHSSGTMWAILTGEYRLFQLSRAGDTLRIVTRDFEPLPVTDRDIAGAIAQLDWFTSQGGRVDRSRVPGTKPATAEFYLDDDDDIWVVPTTADGLRRALDVFDPVGRYLGRVALPFTLATEPVHLFRHGMLYAVTTNDLEVPFVVRARVVRP